MLLYEYIITIIIVVLSGVVLLVASLCYRINRRQPIGAHIGHVITSQTRPLVFYYVPTTFNQESLPPSYDQVISSQTI
jgi:hypothetical protein